MAINYVVPEFNLIGSFWPKGKKPSTDPPDITGIPVQLYHNSLALTINQPQLRLPIGAVPFMENGDIWEVPEGSGRYWHTLTCNAIHQGFPNEFWASVVNYCAADGTSLVRFP